MPRRPWSRGLTRSVARGDAGSVRSRSRTVAGVAMSSSSACSTTMGVRTCAWKSSARPARTALVA